MLELLKRQKRSLQFGRLKSSVVTMQFDSVKTATSSIFGKVQGLHNIYHDCRATYGRSSDFKIFRSDFPP